MSDRLTRKRTKTLSEAFGASGLKGEKGELLFKEYFSHWYNNIVHYTDYKDNKEHRDQQNQGCDFKCWYIDEKDAETFDVKTNLNDNGGFYVENNSSGWLRNPNKISNYIVHLHLTNGRMIKYKRIDMIKYLDQYGQRHKHYGKNNELAYIRSDSNFTPLFIILQKWDMKKLIKKWEREKNDDTYYWNRTTDPAETYR